MRWSALDKRLCEEWHGVSSFKLLGAVMAQAARFPGSRGEPRTQAGILSNLRTFRKGIRNFFLFILRL